MTKITKLIISAINTKPGIPYAVKEYVLVGETNTFIHLCDVRDFVDFDDVSDIPNEFVDRVQKRKLDIVSESKVRYTHHIYCTENLDLNEAGQRLVDTLQKEIDAEYQKLSTAMCNIVNYNGVT